MCFAYYFLLHSIFDKLGHDVSEAIFYHSLWVEEFILLISIDLQSMQKNSNGLPFLLAFGWIFWKSNTKSIPVNPS